MIEPDANSILMSLLYAESHINEGFLSVFFSLKAD